MLEFIIYALPFLGKIFPKLNNMPGFDITKIGQTQEEDNPKVEKLDEDTFMIGDHQIKRRGSVTKQELNQRSWTPDKFVQDGQVSAPPDDGKRDPNTEWIPDDKNALG